MTATTTSLARRSQGVGRIGEAAQDALTIVWRNVIGLARTPQLMVFSTIQPVIFVLMFVYVFGGAIRPDTPGLNYKDFLMPGIYAQTVVFGSVGRRSGSQPICRAASSSVSAPYRWHAPPSSSDGPAPISRATFSS
jgi:ABC-2 type transport system permease protein/oleandomycin transport system permease protein